VTTLRCALGLALVGSLAACGDGTPAYDPGLDGLAITAIDPGLVVPGSRLVIEGRSFVPAEWGDSRLVLSGSIDGRGLDVALDARFVDYGRLEVALAPAVFDRLGGEGSFSGDAVVEVDSAVDGATHRSPALPVTLEVRRELTPVLDSVLSGTLIFVNEEIAVEGDGFLLGGDEGHTVALVEGCFTRSGQGSCLPLPIAEVKLVPDGPFRRDQASFRFAPEIAGIQPGEFVGTVRLENRHAAGAVRASDEAKVTYDLAEPTIFAVGPTAASLGQFVDIEGGGFVGDPDPDDDELLDGATLIELRGSFAPNGGGTPVPVNLDLVPEFVAGRLVRYMMSEDDALGQAIDLRRVTGTFSGTVRPIVQFGGDEIAGPSLSMTLGVAPVKQVVHLVFQPSYVESLRHFGLRAVDSRIRERIVEVVQRDYRTVNLEVRLEAPTDFALYAVVEIGGPDLNGLGLLGYDNSPGKDTGNRRLYDRIGGVNAVTQSDGFPGYGGVFIESLFAFSRHPGKFASSAAGQATETFDQVFDAFRPDRGGDQVTSADLQSPLAQVDGADCPAADRQTKVACAIFVLGNLIGTTLSHEIGHSLGLANPFGDGFHNPSDEPNRLMDSGGDRTFNERAELGGEGPAGFCQTEYEYLRQILPTTEPADPTSRPTCF
jgi:hypothetical protein